MLLTDHAVSKVQQFRDAEFAGCIASAAAGHYARTTLWESFPIQHERKML